MIGKNIAKRKKKKKKGNSFNLKVFLNWCCNYENEKRVQNEET